MMLSARNHCSTVDKVSIRGVSSLTLPAGLRPCIRSRKPRRCVAAAAAPQRPLRQEPAPARGSPSAALQPVQSIRRSPRESTRLRGIGETVEAWIATWSELPLVVQGSVRLVRSCAKSTTCAQHDHHAAMVCTLLLWYVYTSAAFCTCIPSSCFCRLHPSFVWSLHAGHVDCVGPVRCGCHRQVHQRGGREGQSGGVLVGHAQTPATEQAPVVPNVASGRHRSLAIPGAWQGQCGCPLLWCAIGRGHTGRRK